LLFSLSPHFFCFPRCAVTYNSHRRHMRCTRPRLRLGSRS
jgi:hypothetical protein